MSGAGVGAAVWADFELSLYCLSLTVPTARRLGTQGKKGPEIGGGAN